MQVIIKPLEGIILDNKTIKLGMSKEEVISILGKGELENRHFYYNREVAIDYDEKNTIEFIDFLGGLPGTLQPVIYGVSVFESNASELFEVLMSHNGGEITDNEDGFCYHFKEISVGIYRTSTPESVQRDINEMKADGVFDQEYVDEELKQANHWAAIGIGKLNYYK